MNTAISRLNAAKLADFDDEVSTWANRILLQRQLHRTWKRYFAETEKFYNNPTKAGACELVFTYLNHIADQLGDGRIAIDAMNRRMLFNCIARLEERMRLHGKNT